MKKIIVYIFILFLSNYAIGQQELESDFNSAVSLYKSKNYDKSIQEFTEIVGKATDTQLIKYCYIYRAFAYNGLDKFTTAISDFDKAIQVDPSDLATYCDRGKTKAYINDLTGAEKDFLFVLSKDSTRKQGQGAMYYLGKIAYQQGNFEKSVKYYDKLILLTPKDAELYFNRAAAKGMLMDIEGAIRDYDKAIELNPNYTNAYANRGVMKINQLTAKGNISPTKEQTKDACEDLKKAKQLGDNTVDDMIYIHCDKK